MRAAGAAAFHDLLLAGFGESIHAADHGQDRRPLPGGSLQHQQLIARLPGPRRNPDQPRPAVKPHEPHGFSYDLPEIS